MQALLLTAALLTTSAEKATILKAIDNICGDTWCEGEFSFRFDKVSLDTQSNSTRVVFTMSIKDPSEIDANASILSQTYKVSCKVPGYSTYAGIMEDDDRLNWDFYMGMTACIQKLEDRLSRVNRVN